MDEIDSLVHDIKVTVDMTEYNVCNILKGDHRDSKWLTNRQRLTKASDTILGIYFNNPLVNKAITTPGYNPGVLKLSIKKYIDMFQPELPERNECCIHFRLGDRMTETQKEDLTVFNYIEQINNRPHDTITIVCNISYCGHTPDDDDWRYNKAGVLINRKVMKDRLTEIASVYPQSNIKIKSSENVDHDICYLVANGFIGHPDSSWTQIFSL